MIRTYKWLVLLTILACATAYGDTPAWWTSRGVVVTGTVNDYAAVNAGQVKWIASNACAELDANLPGGAGSGVDAVIAGFSTADNYVGVNAGQLKSLAKPFYDRLIAEGYTNYYPWTTNLDDDVSYSAVNIGQVKAVFDFTLSGNADGDGLSDWWELYWFGNLAQGDTDDPDNDGVSNVYEFEHGTDPTDVAEGPVATLHVNPADTNAFATIQAALDAATDYDIIDVADGTYTGTGNRNIEFPVVPVLLRSTNGASACVVDCESSGRGFLFDDGQGPNSILSGFTVRNGSTNAGAGIRCEEASPTIQHSTLVGNTASYDGGGIDLIESSAVIEHCLIISNTATEHGGGGLSFWASTDPVIRNCIIVSNSAVYGGGIYAYGIVQLTTDTFSSASSPLFRNCLIQENSAATNGGGILATPGAEVLLESCTVVDNLAGLVGGGLHEDGGTNKNCIVYNNSNENGYHYGFGTYYHSSCTTPITNLNGTANIATDPAFVGGGDYRLTISSPCVNTGTNASWMTSAFDLDGTDRIVSGTVDMGAYEYE